MLFRSFTFSHFATIQRLQQRTDKTGKEQSVAAKSQSDYSSLGVFLVKLRLADRVVTGCALICGLSKMTIIGSGALAHLGLNKR